MGDPAPLADPDADQPRRRAGILRGGDEDPLLHPLLPVEELGRLIVRIGPLPLGLEPGDGLRREPWPQLGVRQHLVDERSGQRAATADVR